MVEIFFNGLTKAMGLGFVGMGLWSFYCLSLVSVDPKTDLAMFGRGIAFAVILVAIGLTIFWIGRKKSTERS